MIDFSVPVLPSNDALRTLDSAHEKGFRAFLSDIRHNARSLTHRGRASEALVELRGGLRGRLPDPNYDDPYVVAAYLVSYHLQHCVLAYWSFKSLFRQVGFPDNLYVCDVGAGTGAGRVGLALALKEHPSYVNVYFDAYEPSRAMSQAGDCFWVSFQDFVADDLDSRYRWLQRRPTALPKLPTETLRVVTGFHVSLPYDSNISRLSYYNMAYNTSRYSSSGNLSPGQQSIKSALSLVKPNAGIFTCHTGKEDSLRDTVDSFPDWDDKHRSVDIPKDENGVNFRSSFYINCAEDLGFAVPEEEGSPVRTWSRYRFSPAQGVLLLRTVPSQEELLRREQKRVAEEELQRERERKRRIEAVERARKERAEREERERQRRIEAERLAAQKVEEGRLRQEKRKRQEVVAQLLTTLESCRESGETIIAEVVGTNSGGLLVKWEGLSGFVPFSHCRDIANRDDADAMAKLRGQSFDFSVLETDCSEFKLTRKPIIAHDKRIVLGQLSVGQILDGDVVGYTDTHAFVSVAENCDGRVHKSQLARGRVDRVSDAVSLGQRVRVSVLRVDVEQSDLWLSIKDALPNPWDDINAFLLIGSEHTGKVQHIEDNKLLVIDIGDGLQGRIHGNYLGGRSIGDFQLGDEMKVAIRLIDGRNQRILLMLAES